MSRDFALPAITLVISISGVAYTAYYLLNNNQHHKLPPPSTPPGMAPYTTAQNKAIADFRAITNVDKTTAAKLLKASAWNPTQAVNLYVSSKPRSSA